MAIRVRHFRSTVLASLFIGGGCLAADAQTVTEAVVSVARANVRLKPITDSLVIETLSAGAVLEVLADEGGWLRVELPPSAGGVRRIGFIAARSVEKQERIAPPRLQPPVYADGVGVAVPPKVPEPDSAAATVRGGPSQPSAPSPADLLQASVHGGYKANSAYWRQVAKVLKALERRFDDGFNLFNAIVDEELRAVDKDVPVRSKDPLADIALYRELAVNSLAKIETGGRSVDWRQTLAGVQPEKSALGKLASKMGKNAATVIVYGVNPIAGAAVTAASR